MWWVKVRAEMEYEGIQVEYGGIQVVAMAFSFRDEGSDGVVVTGYQCGMRGRR